MTSLEVRPEEVPSFPPRSQFQERCMVVGITGKGGKSMQVVKEEGVGRKEKKKWIGGNILFYFEVSD